jgi:octaprenyl-diphosphate synthase
MSGTLAEIQAPISTIMEEFEKKFRASMKSNVPLLDRIMHYIVKRKGKQMRPMFVFLSAGLCGEINDRSYRAATLIELLHTATLVHDDVVDDSYERRGFFSLNALWKNKIAVLVGDYLLSKGLLLSVRHKDYDLLDIVSQAVSVMSEGELMQIDKARRLDISADIYFEIIRQKTASLIASCCASGAASVYSDSENIARMHRFGELIGIAFQIKDDLFDYGPSGIIGKPTGIDIKESKMTLPLIHVLGKSSRDDRKRIVNIVKNHNTNDKKVQEVIKFVKENGGLEYATERMNEYKNSALSVLGSFPASNYKDSLLQLISFTTERKH